MSEQIDSVAGEPLTTEEIDEVLAGMVADGHFEAQIIDGQPHYRLTPLGWINARGLVAMLGAAATESEAPETGCRICGCTDDDCYRCIERTGAPCYWVEPDLCSACLVGGPDAR